MYTFYKIGSQRCLDKYLSMLLMEYRYTVFIEEKSIMKSHGSFLLWHGVRGSKKPVGHNTIQERERMKTKGQETKQLKRIVVHKPSAVRLTRMCSNYCYGNCSCL